MNKDPIVTKLFWTVRDNWAPSIAIVAGAIATLVAIYYARLPLVEWNLFRQTQTALTSYWMIEEGWRFPYQTPVVGYPWELPFEFPIYQSIVALIAWVTSFSLDAVGRLVSFSFLLACAWPAFQIARRLELPRDVAWVFCALLWSSPLYLFWGRTFTIETAAVFFSLATIPYSLDLHDVRPPYRSAALFALFGSLAMLQKITTAFPVLLVMALVLVLDHIRLNGWRLPARNKLGLVAVVFLIPLAIGIAWTRYADHVRGQNFFGQTTTFAVQSWYYFGELRDRLSLDRLETVFWDRVVEKNVAGFLGLFLIAVAFIWTDRRTKAILFICLILFATPILTFFQVHWFIEYYQTASALFLLAALAIATVVGLREVTSRHSAAPLAATVLVAANFFYFSTGYGHYLNRTLDASHTRALAVGDVIQRYTAEDSAILVFGLLSNDAAEPVVSWSSEIAYYSRRKAFTVEDSFESRIWDDPASYLGKKELGAIVICAENDLDHYAPIIRKYDPDPLPGVFEVQGCYVWLPKVESIVLPNEDHREKLLLDGGRVTGQ
jgi:hypothetical protein